MPPQPHWTKMRCLRCWMRSMLTPPLPLQIPLPLSQTQPPRWQTRLPLQRW
jgi:hypothetical protein